MRTEEWQAFQAQRAGDTSPNRSGASSPYPPAGASSPPPRRGRSPMSWPMVILILGLGMIGGCCYSFSKFVDSTFDFSISKPSVGVLVMEDEIYGSIWVTEALNKFKEDDNIKAVVIRVNSPGGAVAPCQEIYNAIKSLDKFVVISMGSVAASGGLYVASAGNHIMASPGTITGSIGVIMQSVEASGTMDKIGLKALTIKSGEFKDMGSPFREMRESERRLLQGMVMDVYEQFVNDLAAGRENLSVEQVRAMADGRIFNGSEALKLGLIDELGGFEDAVSLAAKRGGLSPIKRPNLVIEDGSRHWWEGVLFSSFNRGLNINLPPALKPGFSLKYIYQPDMGASDLTANH